MLSIKENCTNEIIINKSKFITELIKVNNEQEVKIHLDNLKKKYSAATHYCYAYICGNKKKYSDDGEPNKTAGAPILNVLDGNDLNNVLCVVIRYFGGIKLGAGGLVRAYTNAVTKCLEKISIVRLVSGYKVELIFPYDNIKQIDYLLANTQIIEKVFDNKISYSVLISDKKYREIYHELELCMCEIDELEKIMIEE